MTTTQQQYYYATGRRKNAIARVRLYMESGPIVVNGKPLEDYVSLVRQSGCNMRKVLQRIEAGEMLCLT